MRVSGRKLRLAVGTGIAALMLTLGVSSVGATTPQATGGILVIVTGPGASASHSTDPNDTNTTFRDAVAFTNSSFGGGADECGFFETGNVTNAATTRYGFVGTDYCAGTAPRAVVAAYPLWENQKGFGPVGVVGVNKPGKNTFVVPPTFNPRNGTVPTKDYVVETFR